jgi:hypothetical protein
MTNQFFSVWGDWPIEESKRLKWRIDVRDRATFTELSREFASPGSRVCELLLKLGYLEAVDDGAAKVVKKFVASEIKAELTAAVDKKRFHEPDVRSFALDDFIQFLGPAIWNISRFLIIGGTKLMSDVAIGLSDPNKINKIK